MFIKYALCIALFATAMTIPVEPETSSLQPRSSVIIDSLNPNEDNKLLNGTKNVDSKQIHAQEELITTTTSPENVDQNKGFWNKLMSVFGNQKENNSTTVLKTENKIKNLKVAERKSRTIYLTENDGSYVAVVVPSEAVMSQLQATNKPAPGEVKKTIYLETVPRGRSINSEKKINPVEPVYKNDELNGLLLSPLGHFYKRV